jgi:DNA-binding HxlR family transcriptional regulator
MHAGAYGLSLLSDPLDAQILRALENGSLPLIDLRQATDLPPQTTMRKHLKALTHLGLTVRTQPREFPGAVTYELSTAGLELCAAARAVERWLESAPTGPMSLGLPATKRAIKSVVDAWTSRMLRALAAKPLSLTELDHVLAGVNYPALERRLSAMRLAGQVEAAPGRAGSTPYRVTRWLREAVGPLVAAAHWESRHGPEDRESLSRYDVEAILLLALPLVRLPADSAGSCRLLVELSDGDGSVLAGAVVAISQGRPASLAADLQVETTSTAQGSGASWLAILSGEEESGLSVEGDVEFARAVVQGLRRVCGLVPSASLVHMR